MHVADGASPCLRRDAAAKHASLLAVNHLRFLTAAADEEPACVSAWVEQEVHRGAAAVTAVGGVVDVFCADHVDASFGAVRPLAAPRQAATRAAGDVVRGTAAEAHGTPGLGALASLAANCAVCHGKLLCGDFGSKAAMRFMCIGGVSSLVRVVERLGVRWQLTSLVDAAVAADIENAWDCRLHDRAIYPKRGSDHPVLLWEPIRQRRDNAHGRDDARPQQEWMYTVSLQALNPWQQHNDALQLWFSGHCDDAAAAAAALPRGKARDALQARIAAGPAQCAVVEEVVVRGTAQSHTAVHDASVRGIMDEFKQAQDAISKTRAEDAERQRAAIDMKVMGKRTRSELLRRVEKTTLAAHINPRACVSDMVGTQPTGAQSQVLSATRRRVTVTLTRAQLVTWLPWGMVLDEMLALRLIKKGSVAASCADLVGCIGMVLVSINGASIADRDQAASVMEEAMEIKLLFADSDRPASDSFVRPVSGQQGSEGRAGGEKEDELLDAINAKKQGIVELKSLLDKQHCGTATVLNVESTIKRETEKLNRMIAEHRAVTSKHVQSLNPSEEKEPTSVQLPSIGAKTDSNELLVDTEIERIEDEIERKKGQISILQRSINASPIGRVPRSPGSPGSPVSPAPALGGSQPGQSPFGKPAMNSPRRVALDAIKQCQEELGHLKEQLRVLGDKRQLRIRAQQQQQQEGELKSTRITESTLKTPQQSAITSDDTDTQQRVSKSSVVTGHQELDADPRMITPAEEAREDCAQQPLASVGEAEDMEQPAVNVAMKHLEEAIDRVNGKIAILQRGLGPATSAVASSLDSPRGRPSPKSPNSPRRGGSPRLQVTKDSRRVALAAIKEHQEELDRLKRELQILANKQQADAPQHATPKFAVGDWVQLRDSTKDVVARKNSTIPGCLKPGVFPVETGRVVVFAEEKRFSKRPVLVKGPRSDEYWYAVDELMEYGASQPVVPSVSTAEVVTQAQGFVVGDRVRVREYVDQGNFWGEWKDGIVGAIADGMPEVDGRFWDEMEHARDRGT